MHGGVGRRKTSQAARCATSRYLYIYIGIDRYGKPDLFAGRFLIFICKVSIIRAFAKEAGILDFQLITLGIGLLVLIEKGPRLIIRESK